MYSIFSISLIRYGLMANEICFYAVQYLNNKELSLVIHSGSEGSDIAENIHNPS